MKKLVLDAIYEIEDLYGHKVLARYMGRQKEFSCCVCNKGNNAYTFNVADTVEELENGIYETWGYGKEHFPKVIRRVK